MDFKVLNVSGDATSKTIHLLANKHSGSTENPSTYYCFYETKGSLASEYGISFETLSVASDTYVYVAADNSAGLFFDSEESPTIYCLKEKAEVDTFIELDPILTSQSSICKTLTGIANSSITDNDIWLIRTTMNEFDSMGVDLNSNQLNIWKIKSDHYGFKRSMIDNRSVLLCFILPKMTSVTSLRYITGSEFDDPTERIDSISYLLELDIESSLVKYNSREIND